MAQYFYPTTPMLFRHNVVDSIIATAQKKFASCNCLWLTNAFTVVSACTKSVESTQ